MIITQRFALHAASFLAVTLCLMAIGNAETPAVPVVIEKAESTTLVKTLDAVGYVHAHRSALIRAKSSDRIIEITVTEGKEVKQGQLLMQFDDKVELAQLKFAKLTHKVKKADLSRMEKLVKKNVIAPIKLPETQQSVVLSMVDVEKAELALENTRLRAPFDGVLGAILVEPGDTPNADETLTTIYAMNPVQVRFRLPQRKLTGLAVGLPVNVWSAAHSDHLHAGRIVFISPALDPETKSIEVKAVLDDSEDLLPGMFVSVAVEIERLDDAVTVSDQALVATPSGFIVIVAKDGKAKMVPVQIGLRDGERVQILKGINAGDDVVSEGQLKLHDGMAVVATKLATTDTPDVAAPKMETKPVKDTASAAQ
jgi:membrane fusion protein, multidrug efflux system